MSAETTETPSAVARAEALLTRWERKLAPSRPASSASSPVPTTTSSAPVARAERIVDRAGQGVSGRGVMRLAALSYVWTAARVADIVSPLQQSWQQAVAEARREEEQQAARRGGPGAARQEERKEHQGEGDLKKTAGTTAEAAGTAADAAGA